MKKLSLAIALLLTPALAQAWPWSQDMANQISIKPQEPVGKTGAMSKFPARSVPTPGTTVSVRDLDAAKKMANPVPANERSVAQGKHLFEIYCASCHGKSGTGDGYVGEKLTLKPWNLTSSNDSHPWNTADYPDGYIWGYMTMGGAVMPAYANDLTATERWHVVNYIRKVLQKAPAAAAAGAQK